MSGDTKIISAFGTTAAGWDSVDLVEQPRSLVIRWPRDDIFIDQGAGPYRVRNRTISFDQIRRFAAYSLASTAGSFSPLRIVLEHHVADNVWTLDLGSTPSPQQQFFTEQECRRLASEALAWTDRINARIVERKKRPAVLVVEDRDEVRDQLKELVRAEGYQPHEAATIDEAVQKAREIVPDMILLDLELPQEEHSAPNVRGGLDVVRQIADMLRQHRIPIAIVTKQELSSVRQEAKVLEIYDLFNKDEASLRGVSKWLREHYV